jgi:hypothetical protein
LRLLPAVPLVRFAVLAIVNELDYG